MKVKDAAAMAGITKEYLSQSKYSEAGMEYHDRMTDALDERALDMSSTLQALGREAVEKLAGLMRFSPDDKIVLRAAQDLADRSVETRKTQSLQVESFSIGNRDAKEIAAALVEAAVVRKTFDSAATGDYVRVPEDNKLLGEGNE